MLDLSSYKTVLSFFSHPDDEVLAAGATIAQLTRAGTDLHVAIPATGIHSRRNVEEDERKRKDDLTVLRKDCEQALSIVGVKQNNIHFGEFSDNEMDKHSLLELIHWLEQLIAEIKPDLILTHHRWCTNIDHQYCHEAAIVATRPSENCHIDIICGEIPSSTGYLKPTQWEPNLYVSARPDDVELKISAMEAYKGEARPDPHPRSPEVLRALAKVRGSESGHFFAESFMIHRVFAS